jgi:hypothetical protein
VHRPQMSEQKASGREDDPATAPLRGTPLKLSRIVN